MNSSLEYVTALQYRLKAAEAKIEAFESGEKYVQICMEKRNALRRMEREIKGLKEELSRAHSETVSARNRWFEVFEDLQKEYAREVAALEKENARLRESLAEMKHSRDLAEEKRKEQLHITRGLEVQLEEERGKNLKLCALLNRDYENSSLPSSKTIRHKKISNSREKSGKRPGGQPGHEGHGRKKQVPTKAPILLPPPQEVLENPDFKKTSETIVKQLVNIRMGLDVTEYHADVYYNPKTGERIHGQFPAGVVDDVNYGGSVKAFLFLLNNDCCTSIDKSRKFLSDLTGGKLNISKGMVNKLPREFSNKSKEEREKIFADMLSCPVMHTDNTNAKVNGRGTYVFVCATPDGKALYFSREKKGHEGIKGTVVEDYTGILVHDHDRSFYKYGSNHQECLAHILRYLKDSIDNEPDRQWNTQMRLLVQEMIHYRNSLPPGTQCDAEKVSEFEMRYRQALEKAKEEYEYIPPNKYYKDGYNLYRRMEEYMDNHLLFLHDIRVPPTNNEAERLLRGYKRKQQQAVTFRGDKSIGYLCECMGMLVMLRQNEKNNLFEMISQIYG